HALRQHIPGARARYLDDGASIRLIDDRTQTIEQRFELDFDVAILLTFGDCDPLIWAGPNESNVLALDALWRIGKIHAISLADCRFHLILLVLESCEARQRKRLAHIDGQLGGL